MDNFITVEDKLSGNLWDIPAGESYDQTKFRLVEERAPGYQGFSRTKDDSLVPSNVSGNIDANKTVNSNDITSFLKDIWMKDSPIGNIVSSLTPNLDPKTLGGLSGGIAGPMVLGALRGVPGGGVGVVGGAISGAIGGGALQAAQDYLTTGQLNYPREAGQAIIGGLGAPIGKMAEGATTLIPAALRQMGALPNLIERAMSGPNVATEGMADLAARLPEESSSPIAQRSSDFINKVLGNVGPEQLSGTVKGPGGISLSTLQAILDRNQGNVVSGLKSEITPKEAYVIQNDIGSLKKAPGIPNAISGDWYRSFMDILRRERDNGNQAAADILQSGIEQQMLEAVTPPHLPYWLGGGSAASMGLGLAYHSPQMAAGILGTTIGAPILTGLLRRGEYNPYVGGLAQTGLEDIYNNFMGPQ